MIMEDVYTASTEVISGQEETIISQRPSHLPCSDTGCSSAPFKRKRGRPRKQSNQPSKPSSNTIDVVTMEIVAGNALKEIQGSLGMGQTTENNEDARFMEMLKEPPVKRGRGRPKKNAAPTTNAGFIGMNKAIPIQPPIDAGESSGSVKKGRGRPRKIPLLAPVVDTSNDHLPDMLEKFESVSSNCMSEPMFAEPAKLLRALPECEVTKSQVDIARVAGPSTTLHLLKDKTLNNSHSENPSKPIKPGRGRPRKHPLPQPNTIKDVDTPLPSVGGVVEFAMPAKRKRGRPPAVKAPPEPVTKRPRGRPKRGTLDSNTLQEPNIKRKPGRPKKTPDPKNPPDIPDTPQEPKIKRKPGRPKKNPDVTNTPREPKIKRKRGRPAKNPKATETTQEPKIKRKRGRPKKEQSSDRFLDSIIPAQSSEPVSNTTGLQPIDPFPIVALAPPGVFSGSPLEDPPHNISNETITSSRGADRFKLQLSSSEYETADSASIEDDVAMAIVTLSGGDPPRRESPLLNESFDESFDEDD